MDSSKIREQADPRREDDATSSNDDHQCWTNALSAVEIDFRGLFRVGDLSHFSNVLTEQEMKLCASLDNTDKLSREVFKYLCKKPVNLLKKVPDCLRAAGNQALAKEWEDAHQRQVEKLTSKANFLSECAQYASTPVEVQQREDDGTLAFASPAGRVHEVENLLSQTCSPASCQTDSTSSQQSVCQEVLKKKLHSVECKMAKLKADHDKYMVELKRVVAADEEFEKHPAHFLKQLFRKESSEFNAMHVLEQAFPYSTESETVSDAFNQLLYSCFNHCLNPELLVKIAEIIKDSEQAEKQKMKLVEFCSSLEVETYINMREYMNFPTTSLADLSEIVMKLNQGWSGCTVEQVLVAIHEFCHVVEIPPFLCRLRHIHRASACIALTVLVPKGLTTNLEMRVEISRDKLEASNFVEVRSNEKELFSLKDTRITTFVSSEQEPLPPEYGTTDHDDTAKMYQLLRLCQKHYGKMFEFSHSVPQHFWRYFALRCLKLMGGNVTETASSLHEEQIAACFNDCVLNVSDNCLDRHVQAGRGERVALVYESVSGESGKVTYKELLERTCRIANVLKKHGVHRGDCVVIYMPLCPQAVASMLACARIGAKHCAIPSSSSTYILKQRLLDANAVALMTVNSNDENSQQQRMFMTVDRVLSEQKFEYLKVYYSTGKENITCIAKKEPNYDVRLGVNFHHIETEMTQVSDKCDCEPMKGNDPLFVMYTSGTTGGPKGLKHTQAGYLLYVTVTYQVLCHYEPGDIMAFFTDLGWIISHSYAVHGALSSGGTTFLYDGSLRDRNISWLWELVEKHKISQLMTTPSMLASMMNRSSEKNIKSKPDCLKFLMSGGEHLPCLIRKWYKEKLQCQICDSYGQTETGSAIMCNRVVRNEEGKIEVQESSLQPFFGVHPILINSKSKKEEKRCCVSGTLFLRLPLPGFAITIDGDHDSYKRMYWDKADEHPNSFKTFDGVYRDKDGGYIITGRVDDVITIGEHHYGPSVLESTLESAYVVEQAVAVMRGSVGGETGIMFFVVLKEDSNYDLIKMETYLKEKLIDVHKSLAEKPVFFLFVKELPTTQSAKTSRHYLREIAAGRGIRKRTDLESLHKPSTPLDINMLFSLYAAGTSVLAHESADYIRVYQTSLDYPEVFWCSLAKSLLKWRSDNFVTIDSCNFETGHVEWFKEGILNATESCLDRHVEHKDSCNVVALIHYQPDLTPKQITYKELKEMTCRIANLMIEAQLKYNTVKADVPKKVMICMPLTPLAVASMLACARIGAVHYNVPMDIPPGKLWEKFDTVLPSAIVTVHSLKDKMMHMLETCNNKDSVTVFLADVPQETILSDLNCNMVDLEKEMQSQAKDVDAVALGSNFPILAMFLSMDSTTAVYHSHAGFLLHSAASHKYVLDHQPGDRLAITNDLSSLMCLVYSVYGLLCNGGTAVLFDDNFRSANPGWPWKMLSRARVTQFLTTPDFIKELRQSEPFTYPMPELRIIGISGKQLSKNDWNWLKEEVGRNKWTIIDHYGKPEIGGCLIASRPYLKVTRKDQTPGSPMVPFFGVSSAILGADKGEITEPGVEGDLCIKSAIPGMGTHLHRDSDGRVMFNNYFRTYPGYFKTGDRAYKDEYGNYHIASKQQY